MNETLIAVVILQGLVSAFFCATIASNKGHNSGAWFLLGLLFGIFALLASLGLEKVNPTDTVSPYTGKAAPYDGQVWKCAVCGFENIAKSELCQNVVVRRDGKKSLCSNKRGNTPLTTMLAAAVPTTEKKCPMCAEMVKVEAKICRFCGHKFVSVDETHL